MKIESEPTTMEKRTDGGHTTDTTPPWGGSREKYTHHHKAETATVYIPPEEFQDGPLDFYIYRGVVSRDKDHLFSGPEYRGKLKQVYNGNQDSDNSPSEASICGLKEAHLGFGDVLPHFLSLLADIGFDGIETTVPDLHSRPGNAGYRMIAGSPLTVYQTCCKKCVQAYQSEYTTEEIETEVRNLTE